MERWFLFADTGTYCKYAVVVVSGEGAMMLMTKAWGKQSFNLKEMGKKYRILWFTNSVFMDQEDAGLK